MAEENRKKEEREEPGRVLASSEELKGRKSGSGRRSGKKGRFPAMTVILLAVLALATLVYVISRNSSPVPAEEAAETKTASLQESVRLIDRTREEVAGVSVEIGGERYTVVNKNQEAGSVYMLKDLPWFSLDQEKAGSIIGCAASLTANRVAAENAENLEDFGLKEPVSRVTMSYQDGTETNWLVGTKAPTSTASYFMEEGTEKVYLLYASAIESLSRRRNELHTLDMPGTVNSNLIRSLLIEAKGQDPVEIGYSEEEADKNYSISALRLRQPFYYTANVERVSELFNSLATLTVSSYAGEVSELPEAGLEDNGERFRITVCQKAEEGNETETLVFRVGGFTADGESVYLSVDETDAVYLTEASAVAFLNNATPAYLVDQFSNLIYINVVRSVEIEAGDRKWILEIVHGKDEKAADEFFFNGEKVKDDDAFRKLYQQIVGTTHSKISEDYHLDGEVLLSVRYLLEVEPGEVLVEYLVCDGDYCAVRRDGLTLFLIKRNQVEALAEALETFRTGQD